MKLKTNWQRFTQRAGPEHYARALAHGMRLSVRYTMTFPYGWRANVFGRDLQSVFAHAETAMEEADRHAKLALERALETYREEARAKKAERRAANRPASAI